VTFLRVWDAGGRCRRARRAALAGAPLRGGCSNGARWRASQWLENSAEADVAAPVERCYAMWEDRERIPQWMPWIRTVKVGRRGQAVSRYLGGSNIFGVAAGAAADLCLLQVARCVLGQAVACVWGHASLLHSVSAREWAGLPAGGAGGPAAVALDAGNAAAQPGL